MLPNFKSLQYLDWRTCKNRLLIGIGEAQHLMLDLGRKLTVEQVIGEAGEIAAVVVELGQDFSQLCSPSTIHSRP
jgi:hypothetical protein